MLAQRWFTAPPNRKTTLVQRLMSCACWECDRVLTNKFYVLIAQLLLSLHVQKGGLKSHSFHFIYVLHIYWCNIAKDGSSKSGLCCNLLERLPFEEKWNIGATSHAEFWWSGKIMENEKKLTQTWKSNIKQKFGKKLWKSHGILNFL